MSGYVVNMVGLLFAGLGEAGEERECREWVMSKYIVSVYEDNTTKHNKSSRIIPDMWDRERERRVNLIKV
jgi:hypothetical protein